MVEIVAHELNRATEHTLRIIAEADRYATSNELESVLETLGAQMQTLQKRLRILDPLSTAGRQRKENIRPRSLGGTNTCFTPCSILTTQRRLDIPSYPTGSRYAGAHGEGHVRSDFGEFALQFDVLVKASKDS